MSSIRKDAPRLPRPAARYWKGKAPKGAAEAGSDSEDEATATPLEAGDILIEDHQDAGEDEEEEEDGIQLRRDVAKSKSISVALKDVSVSKEGRVIIAGREESGRTVVEAEGMTYDYLFLLFCQTREAILKLIYKESEEEESDEEQTKPGKKSAEGSAEEVRGRCICCSIP